MAGKSKLISLIQVLVSVFNTSYQTTILVYTLSALTIYSHPCRYFIYLLCLYEQQNRPRTSTPY